MEMSSKPSKKQLVAPSPAKIHSLYVQYTRAFNAYLLLTAYFKEQFARDAQRTPRERVRARVRAHIPSVPIPQMDASIKAMFRNEKEDLKFLRSLS
jgi:hypothetical protein